MVPVGGLLLRLVIVTVSIFLVRRMRGKCTKLAISAELAIAVVITQDLGNDPRTVRAGNDD